MGKVTDEQFIDVVVNNHDGLTNQELASKLGVSEQYFYRLRKKNSAKLRNAAHLYVKTIIIDQVKNLERNAKNGDTAAAKYLIEMESQLTLENILLSLQKELTNLMSNRDSKQLTIQDTDFTEISDDGE